MQCKLFFLFLKCTSNFLLMMNVLRSSQYENIVVVDCISVLKVYTALFYAYTFNFAMHAC